MTRKANAPPAIGKASFFLDVGLAAAVAAAGGAGLALRSTIGAGRATLATDGEAVVVLLAVFVVESGAGDRVTVRLTILVVSGMALAVTAFFWVLTALVVVVSLTVGAALVSTVVLASGATGVVFETAGVACVAVVSAGGSAGTGWAQAVVDESAKAAAIAGRALHCASLLLIIIDTNLPGMAVGAALSAR
jgi:hypothetical protein